MIESTAGVDGTPFRRLFIVDEELMAKETRVPIGSARKTLEIGGEIHAVDDGSGRKWKGGVGEERSRR